MVQRQINLAILDVGASYRAWKAFRLVYLVCRVIANSSDFSEEVPWWFSIALSWQYATLHHHTVRERSLVWIVYWTALTLSTAETFAFLSISNLIIGSFLFRTAFIKGVSPSCHYKQLFKTKLKSQHCIWWKYIITFVANSILQLAFTKAFTTS